MGGDGDDVGDSSTAVVQSNKTASSTGSGKLLRIGDTGLPTWPLPPSKASLYLALGVGGGGAGPTAPERGGSASPRAFFRGLKGARGECNMREPRSGGPGHWPLTWFPAADEETAPEQWPRLRGGASPTGNQDQSPPHLCSPVRLPGASRRAHGVGTCVHACPRRNAPVHSSSRGCVEQRKQTLG